MDDLEHGPFGRRLRLLLHHLPPTVPSKLHWEIERGFHLQLLSSELFEIRLKRSSEVKDQGDSALLNTPSAGGASGRLLIWQKPEEVKDWEELSHALAAPQSWEAVLILEGLKQYRNALGSFFPKRHYWRGLSCPVVHVFQDSPPSTFFTVEKNLFVLGRVGRRIERYAKLRRLLPW